MVKYCWCLSKEGFLNSQNWVGMRTKYEKKLCYIHDPEWHAALTVLGERKRARVLQFKRNSCWRKDCQALGGTMQNIVPKPERISVIVILCNINLERA